MEKRNKIKMWRIERAIRLLEWSPRQTLLAFLYRHLVQAKAQQDRYYRKANRYGRSRLDR